MGPGHMCGLLSNLIVIGEFRVKQAAHEVSFTFC